MPLTKQQQSVIDELDFEEKAETALETFIAEDIDTVGPYLTGATGYANTKRITEWGLVSLGRDALTLPSGWEISFNACKAQLVADPKWRPSIQVYRDLEARLTADQWKRIYQGESVTLRADLAADLEKIGGPAGFRTFVDAKES